jgi:Type II secretion system (T2SS), protein G
MSQHFKFVILALVLLFGAALCFVDFVPPRSLTSSRMGIVKRRVLQYAKAQGHLPENLAALPPAKDIETKIMDAWNRPLNYIFDESGIVTLSSLGGDQVEGGDGNNADLVGTFSTRDAEGNWQSDTVSWTQKPTNPHRQVKQH